MGAYHPTSITPQALGLHRPLSTCPSVAHGPVVGAAPDPVGAVLDRRRDYSCRSGWDNSDSPIQ